jgi:predicted nucleic-acid-binding protein
VNALFEEANICFEDGQTVWKALGDFRRAATVKVGAKKKQADFSDALIVNKAKFQSLNKQETFEGVYTFDVAARQIPGTRKP